MLAIYAVCVFPANIKHAVESIHVPPAGEERDAARDLAEAGYQHNRAAPNWGSPVPANGPPLLASSAANRASASPITASPAPFPRGSAIPLPPRNRMQDGLLLPRRTPAFFV
jgi:hypothetical protein